MLLTHFGSQACARLRLNQDEKDVLTHSLLLILLKCAHRRAAALGLTRSCLFCTSCFSPSEAVMVNYKCAHAQWHFTQPQ